MSRRLKLAMVVSGLLGLSGAILGLIVGAQSAPPGSGLVGPAIVLSWFAGLGFALAVIGGILAWLVRDEFLKRLTMGSGRAAVVMLIVFGIWVMNRTQRAPQAPVDTSPPPTQPTEPPAPGPGDQP